jgi:hypothetical protein
MSNTSIINNHKHWRERAEEARVMAEQMVDPEARRMMLGIADGYDKLASRAEQRAAQIARLE